MYKKAVFAVNAVFVVVSLAIAACSVGLDPASNYGANKASLSLKIGALVPPADSFANGVPSTTGGRLIAPDFGYLYFRTIGGPVGSSGPFYGPFRVNAGETFKTKAIPAGTYTGIGVLYATKPLDDLTISLDEVSYTFAELMRLPDAEFNALIDSDDSEEGPSPLDYLLDGYASGELVPNVTIVSGKENTLTVTLLPITAESAVDFRTEVPGYTVAGDSAVLERRFISLEEINPDSGNTISSLRVSVNPGGNATYIGRCMLFSEAGTLIRDFGIVGTVETVRNLDAAYAIAYSNEGTDLYLYIEYRTAALSLSFSAVEVPVTEPPVTEPPTPQTLTVSFSGGNSYNQKHLLYSVYPLSAFEGLTEANLGEMLPDVEGMPASAPVAAGVIVLDTGGSGSSVAFTPDTGTDKAFDNGTYLITWFADMDGTYNDLENFGSLPSGGIIPNQNDMVSNPQYAAVVFSGAPNTYTILPSVMTAKKEYVFFVNEGGGSDGDRPDQPCTFNDISGYISEGSGICDVYLTGTISLVNGVYIGCASVDLRSFGSSTYQLIDACEIYTSPLSVSYGSTLTLHNVTVASSQANSSPLVNVSGTLVIMSGASISGGNNDSGAGAIMFNDNSHGLMYGGSVVDSHGSQGAIRVFAESTDSLSTFVMYDGYITNCYSDSYGAITLYAGGTAFSSFTMNGGTISGCYSVSGSGGGVYVDPGSVMTLDGGTIISCEARGTSSDGGAVYVEGEFEFYRGSIQGCEAAFGGAVYIGTDGIMTMESSSFYPTEHGVIDNCSAGTGAGVVINNLGTLNLSNGIVQNCTATGDGGGVYAYGGATLNLSGGSVQGCEAYTGGGLYYFQDSLSGDYASLASTVFINNQATDDTDNIYIAPI